MILQVTRGQWSMYVLGKRNLPAKAKLKLGEMLDFVNQNQRDLLKSAENSLSMELEKAKFLETQKTINAHQQLLVTKKLDSIQKKYKASITTITLMDFFDSKATKKSAQDRTLLKSIKQNTEIEMEKYNLLEQTKLEIKLATLQHEEKVIFRKLN